MISLDGDGTTTDTSLRRQRAVLPDAERPVPERGAATRPQSRPDEAAIASSISQSGSRSYPTLNDPFQSQVEQPRPLGGLDESKIAATLGQQADNEAVQMKAFLKGH